LIEHQTQLDDLASSCFMISSSKYCYLPWTTSAFLVWPRFIPEFNSLISEINDKLAQPEIQPTEEAG
jgi:hypothetical protein